LRISGGSAYSGKIVMQSVIGHTYWPAHACLVCYKKIGTASLSPRERGGYFYSVLFSTCIMSHNITFATQRYVVARALFVALILVRVLLLLYVFLFFVTLTLYL